MQRIIDQLTYNQHNGTFTWLVSKKGIFAGTLAGCARPDGYVRIRIDGRYYYAHRLAFVFMCGRFPTKIVDHINGNPIDNRWCNLREATMSQNHANRRPLSSKKMKGASRCRDKWRACIQVNGKSIHLGTFETEADAHEAYSISAQKYFGQYARIA